MYHLPPTATPDDVTRALRQDGFVIVDNLVPTETMDRIAEEVADYVDLSPLGRDDWIGRKTQRTGALIMRSPTCRELIKNPLVLAGVKQWLSKAATFQLHLTQVITVLPGETVQPLHRDEIAWDFFPFPLDYEVQCSTMWALTDFTKENGATRIVPGSHLLAGQHEFAEDQVVQAEMERGSMFFYTGKIYHGAAANRSNNHRQGINLTYAVGWVRQEENQYLSIPLSVAKTLDDELLKIMGYQLGGIAVGYVRDFEDPMVMVREDLPRVQFSVAPEAQVGHVDAEAIEMYKTLMAKTETPAT